MEEVKKRLKARERELITLKMEKEKALRHAPEGHLRVCNSNNRTQYYYRTNPEDFNGTYLKEEEFSLAKNLAQKDYDQKVLKAAEKELKAIEKYFSKYPKKNVEEILESLHKERQKLIVPITESDQEYIKGWESVEYEGKGFRETMPELLTARGEKVRSKSEVIIADLLDKESIPYRYEYPVYLNGVGMVYTDFTCLNVRLRKEIRWEHFGMMDHPEYVENAIQKIASYEKNGFFPGENLILTYETLKTPINQKVIRTLIGRYLK